MLKFSLQLSLYLIFGLSKVDFISGHHTTSIGMSFAVQEIGRNPEILKRLACLDFLILFTIPNIIAACM